MSIDVCNFLIDFILCGGIIIKEEIIDHFLEGVLIFNKRFIVDTLESERQRTAVLCSRTGWRMRLDSQGVCAGMKKYEIVVIFGEWISWRFHN